MNYVIALTLFFAPTYVWRFSVGPLPTNVLMAWIVVVWIVFVGLLIVKQDLKYFVSYLKDIRRLELALIALFFLAGIISLFAFGITQAKLGSFIVWFIQPISLYFIAGYLTWRNPQLKKQFQTAVYVFVAAVGLYALLQYFTRLGLPAAYWGNSAEPKRALGFFIQPDMFGLFLAPLLAWLIPDVLRRLNNWKQNWPRILMWLAGCVGLLLSLSRGGWLGLIAAAIVGLVLAGRKKHFAIAGAALVIIIIAIIALPNLRYRLILPFKGEKSSVARISLWQTGEKMIRDNPILGKGINGFDNNWYKYNTDAGLDHYNFPHNILLNFWVDTGLLGMISFVALLIYGAYRGLKNRADIYQLGLLLFLVALAVHGLIDIPYLKNDLALEFWLIWAISLTNSNSG